ncbi:STAS domain-containing protein [Paraconexibacter antarcticus]|uniref:STAS domain-containing protein n=1 Tax=Paraconexibacter antarcticus TaxID=2949664 RepID=A0ABY5DRT0_9ACTN|nr:STAS domain-containing protein [Paraconexibacter antarcticus]UTI64376.1 STAS domain-containing protein [Paraconexibacter antarcticus]
MRPGEFRTDLEKFDARTHVLRCFGELDITSMLMCRQAVMQVTAPCLVLDLRELSFLDSSGIAVLLIAQRRHRGGRLATCVSPGGRVARILALAGLEPALGVSPSIAGALAALSPADGTPHPADLDLPPA